MEPDARWKAAAGEYSRAIAPLFASARASWARPEQYHVTLHFFGEVDEATLRAIKAGLSPLGGKCAPPRFAAAGLEFLPSRRSPRVLCLRLAVEPEPPLSAIVAEARRIAEDAGAAAEARPWRAHLTLARFRAPRVPRVPRVPREPGPADPPPPLAFTPSSFDLVESFLSPRGPRYEIIERYCFAKAETGERGGDE